jgi:hypothetical protein
MNSEIAPLGKRRNLSGTPAGHLQKRPGVTPTPGMLYIG